MSNSYIYGDGCCVTQRRFSRFLFLFCCCECSAFVVLDILHSTATTVILQLAILSLALHCRCLPRFPGDKTRPSKHQVHYRAVCSPAPPRPIIILVRPSAGFFLPPPFLPLPFSVFRAEHIDATKTPNTVVPTPPAVPAADGCCSGRQRSA